MCATLARVGPRATLACSTSHEFLNHADLAGLPVAGCPSALSHHGMTCWASHRLSGGARSSRKTGLASGRGVVSSRLLTRIIALCLDQIATRATNIPSTAEWNSHVHLNPNPQRASQRMEAETRHDPRKSAVHRQSPHHRWPGRRVRSADGRLDIRLSSPGAAGNGTNPEQLFAAGWSACFLSAMKIEAGKMKIALPAGHAIDAEVDLGTTGGGYVLQARLNVSLPGLERGVARALVDAAHQTCPYSKATRGNIDVVLNVSKLPSVLR